MPPTSWVELALAGLAEPRGHDGARPRETVLSQLCLTAAVILVSLANLVPPIQGDLTRVERPMGTKITMAPWHAPTLGNTCDPGTSQ